MLSAVNSKKIQPFEYEEIPPDMNRFYNFDNTNAGAKEIIDVDFVDMTDTASKNAGAFKGKLLEKTPDTPRPEDIKLNFRRIDEMEALYVTGRDGKSFKQPKKSIFSKLAGLFKKQ